jgi:cell division protein FtsI (penicillin-binding protein 3)
MRYVEQEELPLETPVRRAPGHTTAANSRRLAQSRPVQNSSGNFSRSGSVDESWQEHTRSFAGAKTQNEFETSPEVPAGEPWHQRLVERFFAVPEPVDPLKKNGRLYISLAVFLIAYLMVVGKLFKIQVVDHAELSKEAASQYQMQVPIEAKRGLIRDRNGVILAANAYVVKFAVDPRAIQHKQELAYAFARTFSRPVKDYITIFNDTTRRYIVVEKEVPLEVAAKLDSVRDHGLIREMESRRNYAFNDRASHIIGFSSKDGRGLAGIELMENRELGGHDGFQIMQRDGRGGKRPDVDYDKVAATDGDDVTLTIDEAIQSITESALKSGVETAKAEAGIAIVMNPRTGEILALANAPDFNPNDFGHATNDMLRNRAITDAYEPGSTIKVLTAAATLEDHAMKPEDKIDAEHGHWAPEKGVRISDTHEYGILTFREALEKSSNVCFAKISDRLDKRRFYKYLRDFGLGNYTGIDLPGEVKGVLHKPSIWGGNSKRYMAFGYELTATPIQMATAYATVANFGMMMKPYIIAKRSGNNGTIEYQPQEIRRVISEASARTLIGMMTGVVDSGTATLAKIKGVSIAGKTGTAQQLVGGHWSKEHYTSSFTGFFPAEKPQYLISVILRSPHNGYYGGTVSGPIFREIAMRVLEMTGQLPNEARSQIKDQKPLVDEGVVEIEGTVLNARTEEHREMPEVRGLTSDAGRELLASQGFTVVNAKSDNGIIDKVQECGRDSVRFILSKPHDEDRRTSNASHQVPDFSGMPVVRAIKFAASKGLRVRAVGSGKVQKQFPLAGAMIEVESGQSPTVTLFGAE